MLETIARGGYVDDRVCGCFCGFVGGCVGEFCKRALLGETLCRGRHHDRRSGSGVWLCKVDHKRNHLSSARGYAAKLWISRFCNLGQAEAAGEGARAGVGDLGRGFRAKT
eukprot:2122281-Pleurochrysis_carterae.AAC.2